MKALERQRWTIFWDRRIPAGQTWRSYIGQALTDAKCVIVAWSHDAIQSQFVVEEADEGKQRGILVPVLLDPVQPPLGFRSIHAADLTGAHENNQATQLRQLFADIETVLRRSSISQDEVEDVPRSPAPIQGPRPSAGMRSPHIYAYTAIVAALIAAAGYVGIQEWIFKPTPGRPISNEDPTPRYKDGQHTDISGMFSIVKTGALNPIEEGWSEVTTRHEHVAGTALQNQEGTGFDAWYIFSDSQDYYSRPLTPGEKERAWSRGWRLSSSVKPESGMGFLGVNFGDPRRRFLMEFRREEEMVGVGLVSQISPEFRFYDRVKIASPSSGFIDVELVFDPGTQSCDLYVEKVRKLSGYRGFDQYAKEDRGVMFGALRFQNANGAVSFRGISFVSQ